MEQAVKIRRATVRDANLLAALAAATNYETYFETDEPEDLAKYIVENFNPATKVELEDADSTIFLAEVNGKAVGFAKLRENQPADCVKNRPLAKDS